MKPATEQDWQAEITGYASCTDGEQPVCQVIDGRRIIAEFLPADMANLIAAAPDLYRALQNLIAYAAREIGVEPDEAISGHFKEAREALNKATTHENKNNETCTAKT